MFEQNTPQGEIAYCKLDRRVCLQRDSSAQTVDIQTRHYRIFIRSGRLLFHNRRQNSHLHRTQPNRFRLGKACRRPKRIIFPLHPLHQFFGRKIPIDLVCIGDKKGKNRFGGKTERRTIGRIVQQAQQVVPAQHQLPFQPFGQIGFQTDIVKREADRYLMPPSQIVQQSPVAHSRQNSITPCVHVGRVFQPPGKPFKTSRTLATGRIFQLTAKCLEIFLFIHIDIHRMRHLKIRRPQQTIPRYTNNGQHDRNRSVQKLQLFCFLQNTHIPNL